MSDAVPLMDEDAQRLYINAMISNPELFLRVNHILVPSYFDPHLAKGVKFIQEYFRENRTVPADSIFRTATKLPTEALDLPHADLAYVSNQLAEFCRFQACIDVIRKATGKDGYFEKGDLARMVTEMKAASEVGLMVDLGIDYFDNPLARLEADETEDPVISTGWTTVDDVIGGGVGLQELVLFLAPSGGGKSVSMLNFAFNLLAQGYDVVYASLEMRDKKVARRTDTMISRMASGLVPQNKTQVAHEIAKFHEKSGAAFFIKRFREGSTPAEIHAWVRQLRAARKLERGTKKKLGCIVGDYLDIMNPDHKGVGDSMFLKDKYVSEEFRAIGFDENCIMASGSQLEKGATEKINDGVKMHQGNVQGGSSKTNTADLMIATVKTDAMHEAGEYRFEFPKARNSDAGTKQVTMGWNKTSLRIYDLGSELQFKKKSPLQLQSDPPGSKKKTLSDLEDKYK